MTIGGHSDSEIEHLLTAAGQRRIYTELSPLRLMAAPHQNRFLNSSMIGCGAMNLVRISSARDQRLVMVRSRSCEGDRTRHSDHVLHTALGAGSHHCEVKIFFA